MDPCSLMSFCIQFLFIYFSLIMSLLAQCPVITDPEAHSNTVDPSVTGNQQFTTTSRVHEPMQPPLSHPKNHSAVSLYAMELSDSLKQLHGATYPRTLTLFTNIVHNHCLADYSPHLCCLTNMESLSRMPPFVSYSLTQTLLSHSLLSNHMLKVSDPLVISTFSMSQCSVMWYVVDVICVEELCEQQRVDCDYFWSPLNLTNEYSEFACRYHGTVPDTCTLHSYNSVVVCRQLSNCLRFMSSSSQLSSRTIYYVFAHEGIILVLPFNNGIYVPIMAPLGVYCTIKVKSNYSLLLGGFTLVSLCQTDYVLVPGYMHICYLIARVKLESHHCFFRRHDFIVRICNLRLLLVFPSIVFVGNTQSKPFFSLFKWLGFCTHVLDVEHSILKRHSGGGCESKRGKVLFSSSELRPYVVKLQGFDSLLDNRMYKFEDHLSSHDLTSLPMSKFVTAEVPLKFLAMRLPNHIVKEILRSHGIFIPQRSTSSHLMELVNQFTLTDCQSKDFLSTFSLISTILLKRKREDDVTHKTSCIFPPLPASRNLHDKIIRYFCTDTSMESLTEHGCAVCGQLVVESRLPIAVNELTSQQLLCFTRKGDLVTKKERLHSSDPHVELDGPILAPNCTHVCVSCWKILQRGSCPNVALANHMWYGEIPPQLTALTYIEKLLISRVRHNRCIVKVLSSGSRKMIANVISFQHPSQKIYAALPPPPQELDDVIAFIFTGPSPPTEEDFKRTPMLVRRKKVYDALCWLKLNHTDYCDLEIALNNLMAYPENSPPVVIDFRLSSGERPIESRAVNDMGIDDGTNEGMCPLSVHGITGNNYTELPMHVLKALALQHLQQGGKALAIGRESEPETLWNNPTLYPMIFPWLFPYGLGGLSLSIHKHKVSNSLRKHLMLMYFDKHFQLDETFALIAFNHEQISRLVSGNPVTGARFFNLMVSMFIKHVLGCQLSADKGIDCQYSRGFYGNTEAYYGTVEQQGRLTLHLHMLIWISGCLSPQKIRKAIMDPSSDFQRKLISYLESCHQGELSTGSVETVKNRINEKELDYLYHNPTETLPCPPSSRCNQNLASACSCIACESYNKWETSCLTETDDILLRTNLHTCTGSSTKRTTASSEFQPIIGCKSNKLGVCKARFPRSIFPLTFVDNDTGYLQLKKGESMMNSFTWLVTFLFRCNTDVTSLLSGTAVKAVVAYISDYISKSPLKTYIVFDTIQSVFQRNSVLLGGTIERHENTRKIMTQIVNTLTSKLEIGAPMASLYLLQHPDHYTSHKFVYFYWTSYVNEVKKAWNVDNMMDTDDDSLILSRSKNRIVGVSVVFDYMYRPSVHDHLCLYDWIRQFECVSLSKKYQNALNKDQSSKINKSLLMFQKDHPKYISHGVRQLSLKYEYVPNFIGPPLPRADKGDHEFYCMTMLTLFKPWRFGSDLKNVEQSWYDAFTIHSFSSDQLAIMENMRVKYECLDARDDFSIQRRSMAKDFNLQFNAHLPENIIDEVEKDNVVDFNVDADSWSSSYIGKKTAKWEYDCGVIEQIMFSAGWFQELPMNAQTLMIPERVTPLLSWDAIQWKSKVNEQRQEVILSKRNNMVVDSSDINNNTDSLFNQSSIKNDVKIVDNNFLTNTFRHVISDQKILLDDIVTSYKLQEDQKRAFRIIAQHVLSQSQEQLKMYLGGMADTGKSRVINALKDFFVKSNHASQFLLLAPTGSAAANIGGSTYHSVLGIHEKSNSSLASLSTVRENLVGVKYIFIDEVSMLSCHDLYKISAQLAKACNMPDLPFGGKNLIGAGDFSQLPPVIGGAGRALFSGHVGNGLTSGLTHHDQESAIGKALWHQITNVVILRKNMRQIGQSDEDRRFRLALENMQYKSCTLDHIACLQSRIVNQQPDHPSLLSKEFRNVSIITAWNSQKDRINELGCEQFAKDTNQTLTYFYSEDTWNSDSNVTNMSNKKKLHNRNITYLNKEEEHILWNSAPHTSEHFAGCLCLCLGMPIIIKHNDATELCINNGQEGIVVGWTTSIGFHDQLLLETLFIKLEKPAKSVQLQNLPPNVVPVSYTYKDICCTLPSDYVIRIRRRQVHVLPNFAMTDYASQGKTREFNVVDLSHCQSHHSYYTALSRSSTAKGTAIVQGFDVSKITGGLSGWLRNEFRELELLNDITLMKFNNMLPPTVIGHTRNNLINNYRKWKGEMYNPEFVHSSIRWSSADPLVHENVDIEWRLVDRSKKSNDAATITQNHQTTQANGSKPITYKLIPDNRSSVITTLDKVSLKWNSSDWSCTYDSLFTLLFGIWIEKPRYWNKIFQNHSIYLQQLVKGFQDIRVCRSDFENIRDSVHKVIHTNNPISFPLGHNFASVNDLVRTMLVEEIPAGWLSCSNCHANIVNNHGYSIHFDILPGTGRSTAEWIKCLLDVENPPLCHVCNMAYNKEIHLPKVPHIVSFDISSLSSQFVISHSIKILKISRNTILKLKGIIYFGSNHFIMRMFDCDGNVWFHDGQQNSGLLMKEQHTINNINLNESHGKVASILIYCH